MKITPEIVLAYITKRHRSIANLSERFNNGKMLGSVLVELHLAGKIQYGRLSHPIKGIYLCAYTPGHPPEGVKNAGIKAGWTPQEQAEREIKGRRLIAMIKEEMR